MEEPKIIAITGPNGSGKTLYVEKMRREMASDSVRYVAFCDSYGQQTDRAYYLQQRWNQHDIDNETPTVAQALQRSYNMSGADTPERRDWLQRLYTTLGLKDSMEKLVISLSSGELRKMQLVKALLTKPKTLIIDNPFIGLDEAARQQLKALLLLLATDEHITIYIVVARPSDIPDYVSEKLEMRNMITPEAEPPPTRLILFLIPRLSLPIQAGLSLRCATWAYPMVAGQYSATSTGQ